MPTSTSIANTPHDPVAPETVTQVAIPMTEPAHGADRGGGWRNASPLADWPLYAVVFVGGCVGTGLRYGLSLFVPAPAAGSGPFGAFHVATFAANMCACFIYAWLTMLLAQSVWISARTRSLVSHGMGMGMCGGFSTLSAMAVEELLAVRDGNVLGAAVYCLASFACGAAMVFLAIKAALAMTARRKADEVRDTVIRQTTVEEADAAADAFLAAHPADDAPSAERAAAVAMERPSLLSYLPSDDAAADAQGAAPADVVAGAAAHAVAGGDAETGATSGTFMAASFSRAEEPREAVTDEIPVVASASAASPATVPAPPAPGPVPGAPIPVPSLGGAEPGEAPAVVPVVVPQIVDDADDDTPSFGRIVETANERPEPGTSEPGSSEEVSR